MPGPVVYSKWPFVGKRRADMESAPTEDVILEEAINKGRGRRRKVAGRIYAAPTGRRLFEPGNNGTRPDRDAPPLLLDAQ